MLENISFAEFISENKVIEHPEQIENEVINEGVIEDVTNLFYILSTKYKGTSNWSNKSLNCLIINDNKLMSNGTSYMMFYKSKIKDKNDLKIITNYLKKTKDEKIMADFDADKVLLWAFQKNKDISNTLQFAITEPVAKDGFYHTTFIKLDKFITAIESLGVELDSSVNLGLDYESMLYNKEQNQIEIKTPVEFIDNDKVKTNTIIIKEAADGINIRTNIISTYASETIEEKIKKISEKLQKFLNKFKFKEFEKLVRTHFEYISTKQADADIIKNVTKRLASEVGTSNFDENKGFVSIKRWDKMNFIFDIANASSADWIIERTLDKASITYLEKLVQKIEKEFKNKVRIQWSKAEKWHIDFEISKV